MVARGVKHHVAGAYAAVAPAAGGARIAVVVGQPQHVTRLVDERGDGGDGAVEPVGEGEVAQQLSVVGLLRNRRVEGLDVVHGRPPGAGPLAHVAREHEVDAIDVAIPVGVVAREVDGVVKPLHDLADEQGDVIGVVVALMGCPPAHHMRLDAQRPVRGALVVGGDALVGGRGADGRARTVHALNAVAHLRLHHLLGLARQEGRAGKVHQNAQHVRVARGGREGRGHGVVGERGDTGGSLLTRTSRRDEASIKGRGPLVAGVLRPRRSRTRHQDDRHRKGGEKRVRPSRRTQEDRSCHWHLGPSRLRPEARTS